jgi:alpha-acetolactate decarboxylase
VAGPNLVGESLKLTCWNKVAKIPNDIFQFSTTAALQAGYTGQGPVVHHLQGYGSFGLGAIAGSNDELIYLDSQPFQVSTSSMKDGDQKHVARSATSNSGLAFVMVTRFVPEYEVNVGGQLEKGSLLDVFNSQQGQGAGGKNSFIPFKVRGSFAKIKIRRNQALRRQQKLDEILEDELVDVKGTVFGFCGPDFFKGVSVTGAHCCFLSDKDANGQRQGASFVDFVTAGEAEVTWAVTGRYHLGFPRGDDWEELDIQTTS